jgi:uncharacterized repeat protein (TIGR01451 family)
MKTLLRSMMIMCMLTALLIAAPAPASAQLEDTQGSMPEGLREAILSGTAKPFREGSGRYLASAGDLNFELNEIGLQAGGEGLQWGIALQGFGRGADIQDVNAPQVKQVGGRVEYQRGVLTEWYQDTALGIEQGFTINKMPSGNDQLILQLNVTTDLEGVLDRNGHGFSFASTEGQTLRYDHLKAYDAEGVELDAVLKYVTGQIQIQVNDLGAAYPITIDPLIYLEQKVLASDGAAGDQFGVSVAISGDTALVGAPYDDVEANADQGSAYVFVRVGTTWTEQAQLTASDGALNDQFGSSIALSGGTALIGAPYDDVGANNDQGSVYVFVRSGTIWTEQTQLTALDGEYNDQFGNSVALSVDTALVGADVDDYIDTDSGSAYVFIRSGTSWSQQQQLVGSDSGYIGHFGTSVALEGDTALVGEILNDPAGAAYVFVRSGTSWTEQAMLTASDGEVGDWFGGSVALSGDTALVGVENDDVGVVPNVNQGSAYVFVRSGITWTQEAQLTALDGAAWDELGFSVALFGDTALVGAPSDSMGASEYQGSAYVFVRNGTTWTQQLKLTASDGAMTDWFGDPVALSGDTALVGVIQGDVGPNADQGAAYFYQAYVDLEVSAVRGTSGKLYPGSTVLLTTSVRDYGPSALLGAVRLNVALPAGLTYVSHSVTHGSYNRSLNSWDVGTLNTGVMASLTITATVDNILAQTLTFSPFLVGHDINEANNSASLTLVIGSLNEIARNGGFNTYFGTAKIPQNWSAANFAFSDGKSTLVKQEGMASVRISNSSAVTKTLTQNLNMIGFNGDYFQFSFWARGASIPAADVCRAQVFLINGSTLVITKTINCSTGTYGFQQKLLKFSSPGSYTKVVIRLTYAKASGGIYFDGLSLMIGQ